jgi:WD40 repeat protein
MRLRYVVTLLLAGVVAAGFRIAPLQAQRAPKSEELLAADEAIGNAGEATAPFAEVVRRLEPTTGAMVVAWSPDGKRIATMGGLQERITLWDAHTGNIIWEKAGDLGGEEALAFSSDGRFVLASPLKSIPEDAHAALSLLDVSNGAIAGRVSAPFPNEEIVENFARKIVLDPGSGLMAVITIHRPGRPVALYDMGDWSLTGTVVIEGDTPVSLAFSHDGTLAVGTVRGKIALFDARKRSLKRTIDADSFVQSIAFSPNGKFLVSGSPPLRIWNAADGTLVRSYSYNSGIHGLSWSPDGRYVASASFDRTVRLWPFTTDGTGQIVGTFKRGGAWSVAFSPDGRFLAAGSSGDDVIVAKVR